MPTPPTSSQCPSADGKVSYRLSERPTAPRTPQARSSVPTKAMTTPSLYYPPLRVSSSTCSQSMTFQSQVVLRRKSVANFIVTSFIRVWFNLLMRRAFRAGVQCGLDGRRATVGYEDAIVARDSDAFALHFARAILNSCTAIGHPGGTFARTDAILRVLSSARPTRVIRTASSPDCLARVRGERGAPPMQHTFSRRTVVTPSDKVPHSACQRELVAWTVKLGVPVILERVVLVRVRPHTGVDPPRARGSRGAHIW